CSFQGSSKTEAKLISIASAGCSLRTATKAKLNKIRACKNQPMLWPRSRLSPNSRQVNGLLPKTHCHSRFFVHNSKLTQTKYGTKKNHARLISTSRKVYRRIFVEKYPETTKNNGMRSGSSHVLIW